MGRSNTCRMRRSLSSFETRSTAHIRTTGTLSASNTRRCHLRQPSSGKRKGCPVRSSGSSGSSATTARPTSISRTGPVPSTQDRSPVGWKCFRGGRSSRFARRGIGKCRGGFFLGHRAEEQRRARPGAHGDMGIGKRGDFRRFPGPSFVHYRWIFTDRWRFGRAVVVRGRSGAPRTRPPGGPPACGARPRFPGVRWLQLRRAGVG